MKKALNLTVLAWLALHGVTQRGADGKMDINVSAQEPLWGVSVGAWSRLVLTSLSLQCRHCHLLTSMRGWGSPFYTCSNPNPLNLQKGGWEDLPCSSLHL